MPKRHPKDQEMNQKCNQNQCKGGGEGRKGEERKPTGRGDGAPAGQRQLGGGLINLKGGDPPCLRLGWCRLPSGCHGGHFLFTIFWHRPKSSRNGSLASKMRPIVTQSADYHPFRSPFWHRFFMNFRHPRNLIFLTSIKRELFFHLPRPSIPYDIFMKNSCHFRYTTFCIFLLFLKEIATKRFFGDDFRTQVGSKRSSLRRWFSCSRPVFRNLWGYPLGPILASPGASLVRFCRFLARFQEQIGPKIKDSRATNSTNHTFKKTSKDSQTTILVTSSSKSLFTFVV
jgi:hypothetical protein